MGNDRDMPSGQGLTNEHVRTKSSRRAILGASIGALTALGAQAIGRPLATRGAQGDTLTAGGFYTATGTTGVSTTGGYGLRGETSAAARAGVYGVHTGTAGDRPGVHGKSPTEGVRGEADGNGVGVNGQSATGIGVSGRITNASAIAIGVSGQSLGGIGVLGYSGSSATIPPKTGVHGYASQDAESRGVSGATNTGHGVHGEAIAGIGVFGDSIEGDGVHGASQSANGSSGTSQSNIASGVYGENTAGGYGVYGRSNSGSGYGVFGEAASGFGVWGNSTSGKAVYGESGSNIGVQGTSSAPGQPAAFGRTFGDNTGVMGYSGPGGPPPASPAKTGVFGYAAQDTSASGIIGQTTVGTGVKGDATAGVGVLASAGANGTAFQAQGRVAFSTSGLASVTVGTSNKTVAPGMDLTASSRILCTLESNQAGLAIQRITKDSAADTFKVFLSTTLKAGKMAKVSWFVIG
jgi:hypothetical protein